MKRVFIVHRWSGGGKDDWLPWLKKELEKLDYEVFVPEMPDRDTPVIEKWVKHLSDIVDVPDSKTYFIGHSIGCQTILRYLENIKVSVGGAIFVAGWFNLENMETDAEKEIARPWIKNNIDLGKVRKVLKKSTLIISDNDPYGCFEENKKKFAELGSKIVVLHNAGHITEDDGYKKLPEVITEFKKF